MPPDANPHARHNALYSAIAALFMILYGWGAGGIGHGPEDQTFLNTTIDIFNWTLKIGGLLLAVVAMVSFAGMTVGLLLDFIVAGACGVVMVVCSGYWLLRWLQHRDQYAFDFTDGLIFIFGLMFLRAALGSWSLFTRSEPDTTRPERTAPTEPEPPHPASIRPRSLPGEDEPPPPEGYLSALAKDEDEPPAASHK